jgi:hypothetical protein
MSRYDRRGAGLAGEATVVQSIPASQARQSQAYIPVISGGIEYKRSRLMDKPGESRSDKQTWIGRDRRIGLEDKGLAEWSRSCSAILNGQPNAEATWFQQDDGHMVYRCTTVKT